MNFARLSTSARLQRVHRLLRDGRARSTLEIVRDAQICAACAAIAELRANGAVIECRQVRTVSGRVWFYRMVRPAPDASGGMDDA